MLTSLVALSLALTACGPAPAPLGHYSGSVEDERGDLRACQIEIESTGSDRFHLHLDYIPDDAREEAAWLRQDGDGATILAEGLLRPDGGGEFTFDLSSLEGIFYSALGEPYHIFVTRDDDME